MDDLKHKLTSTNTTLTWTALQLGQLQALLCSALAASGLNPDSICQFFAVLYTLSIAAPTATACTYAAQSAAINHLVAMVSVILSKQDSADAADSASHKWQEWQKLSSAIGFLPTYLPVLLTPASKAALIQLEAASAARHIAVIRLEVQCQ